MLLGCKVSETNKRNISSNFRCVHEPCLHSIYYNSILWGFFYTIIPVFNHISFCYKDNVNICFQKIVNSNFCNIWVSLRFCRRVRNHTWNDNRSKHQPKMEKRINNWLNCPHCNTYHGLIKVKCPYSFKDLINIEKSSFKWLFCYLDKIRIFDWRKTIHIINRSKGKWQLHRKVFFLLG